MTMPKLKYELPDWPAFFVSDEPVTDEVLQLATSWRT